MESARRDFPAMGTSCRVIGFGSRAEVLVDLAVQRIALLEDCWSRFRPMSELNRLNSLAGHGPIEVAPDLALLIGTMVQAWRWTSGRFDPTILTAIRASGYDADFSEVIAKAALAAVDVTPAPGMGDVVVDASSVLLPSGVGIDPGAIGKGLAADIVVGELMSAGALGILVDLGGDIVVGGQPGDDDQWVIEVLDERDGQVCDSVQWAAPLATAAVATSSALRRRWADGRHHVIDPMTGAVATLQVVQATVIAEHGWQAEAAATAAMLLGPRDGADWLREHELQGLLFAEGRAIRVGHRVDGAMPELTGLMGVDGGRRHG